MSNFPPCPECISPYAYEMDALFICPECGHEWNPEDVAKEGAVCDVNGNVLQNGDGVVVIKSLPVKGAPKPVEGDHNISCKIDGFGAMMLKSEFVKKA